MDIEKYTHQELVEKIKELENERVQFKSLFYSNPTAQTVTTVSTGEIIDANDAICILLEYDRSEMIGRSTTGLEIWADNTERKKIVSKLVEDKKIIQQETNLRTKTGRIITVLFSMEYIVWDNKECILSSVMDITQLKDTEKALQYKNQEYESLNEELKQTNEELTQTNEELGQINEELHQTNEELRISKERIEESETQFKLLFENAPDAIFIQTDWKFRYLNKQALLLLGAKEQEEIIDGNVIDFVHPDFYKKTAERIKNLNEKGEKQKLTEQAFKRLDGTYVETETSAIPINYKGENGALVFLRDITERKLKENELLKAKDESERSKQLLQIKNEEYASINEELRQTINELNLAKEVTEESEEKLRAAMESMSDALVISDFQGNLINFNEAFATFHKFKRKEECANTLQEYPDFIDLFSLDDQIIPIEEWPVSRALKGEKLTNIVYKHKRKDIAKEWIGSYNFAPINDSKSEIIGCVVTARDVTKKIRIENELLRAKENTEKSERLLRTLINTIPDLIWLKDVKGTYLLCNQRFEDFFGAKENEIVGKNDYDFMDKELADFFRFHDKEAMKKGKPTINEELITFASDGHKEFLETIKTPLSNSDKELIGILGIGRDMTSRKEYEETITKTKEVLERNERLLSDVQALSRTGGWEYQVESKKSYWTKELFEIHELDENQNIDHITESLKCYEPEDREKVLSSFTKCLEEGIPYDYEFKFTTFKDNQRWIRTKSKPIYENGRIVKLIGSVIDISEKKEAETKLIEALNKAEESDSLKTSFLQNMSHEIRTPMNAICGFSKMLNKDDLTEEKKKSFVSIIQSSSNQLLSIINDILTVSSLETKQEQVNITNVNINNVIIDLLAMFKPNALLQNLSLYSKQQLKDSQAEIYTDKTKLNQVLSNLISNAIKYTHKGFIEFGYKLKKENNKNVVLFYVKDTGIGINKEYYEKIFERFRQADRSSGSSYGGNGLGLSISKGFVELLGGRIWVESEPDNGSIFYFTIPFKPVNDEQIEFIDDSLKNSKNILVAEDEEFNFLYLEELLIDWGFNIFHTKNGEETVKFVEENSDISLVLMDIKMPQMTGDIAAGMIKEFKPNMPIIAQTAYALEKEMAKYQNIFDGYLTKPISEEKLKEIVDRYS